MILIRCNSNKLFLAKYHNDDGVLAKSLESSNKLLLAKYHNDDGVLVMSLESSREISVRLCAVGTYLKLSLFFLSKTVSDCLKLSQSSKIVAMCLNL